LGVAINLPNFFKRCTTYAQILQLYICPNFTILHTPKFYNFTALFLLSSVKIYEWLKSNYRVAARQRQTQTTPLLHTVNVVRWKRCAKHSCYSLWFDCSRTFQCNL